MDDDNTLKNNANVATIAAAYFGNPSNPVAKADVTDIIRQIDAALKPVAAPEPQPMTERPSASAVRKSNTRDHLVSFLDGRSYKTLKRHLDANGLTPEAYRERFGLRSDYPMTAPNYSKMRSNMAQKIGLGRFSAVARQSALSSDQAPAHSDAPAIAESPKSRAKAAKMESVVEASSTEAVASMPATEAAASPPPPKRKAAAKSPLIPIGAEKTQAAAKRVSRQKKAAIIP